MFDEDIITLKEGDVHSEPRAAFHTVNSEFLTEWPLRVG